MKFYDIEKKEVSESYAGIKWVTNVGHKLKPKNGFNIVYDEYNKLWYQQANNPKSWIEYLIKIGRLQIGSNYKVDDNGNIVEKTLKENLLSNNISEETYRGIIKDQKQKEINQNVESIILNDFYSSVTGQKVRYQTSLTDQFEISQIKSAGIDFNIKVFDENGNSNRLFHTVEQINILYNEFFLFVTNVKALGDQKKFYLRDNFSTMNLIDLEDYITSI